MNAFAARALSLEFANTSEPFTYHALQKLLVHRFSVDAKQAPQLSVREHAWEMRSDTMLQAVEIEAESVFSNDSASQILRNAVFEASPLQVRVVLPDTSIITSRFAVSRYDLLAEDGDILRAVFQLVSADALVCNLA